MDLNAFISHIRFLANDGPYSNLVQREWLAARPGNVFDGVNTIFQLCNRRITEVTLYDETNTVVDPSGTYTVTSGTGRITMTSAPTSPNSFTDYYFQKLDDTEMAQAISGAAASGGFDPNAVVSSNLDFCALYSLAYTYMAMASKSSEYYTLSAAGKQVSKSEIFNHYQALAGTTLAKAQELRTDMFKDRGQRDIPSDAHGSASFAVPYTQDSNE